MSILLKGIELPKENQRGLWVVIHADGTVEYDSGDEGWKTLKQAAYPVPPHGRLIDADAMCEGLVTNHPVVIYARCAPTIIPADKEAPT